MGDQARVGVGSLFAILLAQHLRRLRVFGVIEPSLDAERTAFHANVAEGEHIGVGRRTAPLGQSHLLGRARSRDGIEALGDHVENARRLQVIPQGDVEVLGQLGRGRIAGYRLEIRHGDADLLHTEAGAGANPVLGVETG